MASNFRITNAGIQAVRDYNPLGPQIYLDNFKVGADFGYTTLATDVALHGTIRYSGGITNIQPIDTDTVQLTLTMNEGVGDFTYGEIGIYTHDGILFGIYAFAELQQKRASIGNQVGNRIIVKAKLKLVNLTPTLFFPILNPGTGLPEAIRFSTLDPTDPEANAYSIDWGDGCGNNGLALWNSHDELWGFPTHVAHFDGTVDSSTLSTVTCTEQEILNVFDVAPGVYVMQVLSGPYKGYLREVTAVDGRGEVSFFPMTPVPLPAGTPIRINVSNCFWIEHGQGVQWAGAFEYNALATRLNAICGTPNGDVPLPRNKGYDNSNLPLLLIPERPTAANWAALYDRLRRARKHQGADPSIIDAQLITWNFWFRNSNPYGYGLFAYQQAYAVLLSGIMDMETNKDQRNTATLVTLEPLDSGRGQRQTTWTGMLSHTAVFTFNNPDHVHGWFNSGCRLGHRPTFGDPADSDDYLWVALSSLAGTNKLAYGNTFKNNTIVVSGTGFYALVVGAPEVTLVTVSSSGKTYILKASRPTVTTLLLEAQYLGGDTNTSGDGYGGSGFTGGGYGGGGPVFGGGPTVGGGQQLGGGSYGYGGGTTDAYYGLYSQFILERHNHTYLENIPYPSVVYTLNGFNPVLASVGIGPVFGGSDIIQPAGPRPILVNTSQAQTGINATMITVPVPVGTANGDIVILFNGATNPCHWSGTDGGGFLEFCNEGALPSIRGATKIAVDIGTDVGGIVCHASSPAHLAGAALTYSGGSYDVSTTIVNNGAGAVNLPSLYAASDNSILIATFFSDQFGVSFPTPTGMTPLAHFSGSSGPSWAIFTQNIAAGTTGGRSSNPGTAVGINAGVMMIIGPA